MPEVQAGDNLFINKTDVLANVINTKANELYRQLITLDVEALDTADMYKDYFRKHHLGRRLFFSLQNSAHIIYDSVKKTGKQVNELTFMDYGAGLGTLFMLAGKTGFKQVVYNDYFPEWHQPAKVLCQQLHITIDHYVEGDIASVTAHASLNNILYDIIASRNVIEHIYSLPHFFKCIHAHNSHTVTFSTTTANYHNPVMRWYHIYLHKKWEKISYRNQRMNEIKKLYPSITNEKLTSLVNETRGKGQYDFIQAVHDMMSGKTVEREAGLRSNSCDCITGVWNEHLLSKKEYRAIINEAGFTMEYSPGYWDTHYRSAVMNMAARIMNRIIVLLGNRGVLLSPFVNVTAHH